MALTTSVSLGDVVVKPACVHAPGVACHMSMYAHGSWLTSLLPDLLLEIEQPLPLRSSANHAAGIPAVNSWLPKLSPAQLHEPPIDGLQSPAPACPLSAPVTSAT